MDKLSYALGISLGQNMVGSGVKEINFNDFLEGLKTVFNNENPAFDTEELNQVIKDYFQRIQEEVKAEEKKMRASNLLEAEAFLEKNSKEDGIQVTGSGLQYRVVKSGQGKRPGPHSRVECHYEGKLADGTVFDSSYKRGKSATFGLDQVIPGWTEGVQMMEEGAVYEFYCPPALGYGEVGIPGHIPGNSVLIFKVELLRVL